MCLTVTKKARPKQSFDLNLRAWDNKAGLRVTVSAFVGFKDLWEITVLATTSGMGFVPSPPLSGGLQDPE